MPSIRLHQGFAVYPGRSLHNGYGGFVRLAAKHFHSYTHPNFQFFAIFLDLNFTL
jgi:hypothetical protein